MFHFWLRLHLHGEYSVVLEGGVGGGQPACCPDTGSALGPGTLSCVHTQSWTYPLVTPLTDPYQILGPLLVLDPGILVLSTSAYLKGKKGRKMECQSPCHSLLSFSLCSPLPSTFVHVKGRRKWAAVVPSAVEAAMVETFQSEAYFFIRCFQMCFSCYGQPTSLSGDNFTTIGRTYHASHALGQAADYFATFLDSHELMK